MTKKELQIELAQMAAINEFSADFSKFGEDYIFAHITPDVDFRATEIRSLIRFNSLSIILCREGNLHFEINNNIYNVGEDSIVLLGPESAIKLLDTKLKCDFFMLFFSQQFLRDINIEINAVDNRFLASRPQPVVQLSRKESLLLQDFMAILHKNAAFNRSDSTSRYTKNISRCVMEAIVYHLMRIGSKLINSNIPQEKRTRRKNYVKDFVSLVVQHHVDERSVTFYAKKLFISPKYLSLIVKETTGRSANQWIDDYVIIAAKRLLRYSGKNIQQTAYELNFPNQSAFGKYFKRITGLSPTEFQHQN